MVVAIGISFNLIIIRVDQRTASTSSTYPTNALHAAAAPSIPLHFISHADRTTVDTTPGGMEVLVSSVVESSSSKGYDEVLSESAKGRWESV